MIKKQIKIVNPCVPDWGELEKDFRRIVKSKNLTTDKWCEKVEKEICKIHKCKYVVLTGSATGAFLLVLISMKYKFSDILMQDFTWKSMKNVVGEIAKFVDIDKDTWLADEPKDKDCLFIPNMTFGNIKTYNHKNTIYDSTHCFGNEFCNGRGLGELISFSPAKIITGCEGGAFITNNKKLYQKVKELRRFHNRISEFNSCFLYHNIKNLLKEKEKRVEQEELYLSELGKLGFKTWKYDCSWKSLYITPSCIVMTHHKMNNEKREKLSKLIKIKQRYKPTNKSNKNSKWIYDHMIMLPMVNDKIQDKIIKEIKRIFK